MSDIFDPLDTEVQTNDDDEGNPLEELVGEGKKFATVEDLARGKKEADSFIEHLQNEMRELREAQNRQMTIEEILTEIRKSNQPDPNNSNPQQPSTPQEPQEPGKVDYSPEKIEELVSGLLQKKQVESQQQKNEQEVEQTLQEKFGNDARVHISKIAKELSVSTDYLRNVARENPAVFYRLIGLDTTQNTPPAPIAPRGSVQTPPSGSGKRNKAYYDRLKQQDRKAYFSEKVQLQMYKDRMEAAKRGESWE